jgi:hypothetical protein
MDKLFTKAQIEKTDKGLTAVASTAVEDRHGEEIDQGGWDIKAFKKNPVLQWAHDHSIPAIGIAKNIRVEGTGRKAQLVFEPVFHDITPEAAALKQLVEGTDEYPPILNSFSVGFRALEMDGNTYTKQELLEISLVNVPANPEARMIAAKSLEKAGFEEEVIKSVTGQLADPDEAPEDGGDDEKDKKIEELEGTIKRIEGLYDDILGKYEDVVKGLQHLNPEGRKSEVVTQRLALAKVAVKAADRLLEDHPNAKQAQLAKVIKRASEKLIVDHKQELKLNGKD